jgi:hypothetical protein
MIPLALCAALLFPPALPAVDLVDVATRLAAGGVIDAAGHLSAAERTPLETLAREFRAQDRHLWIAILPDDQDLPAALTVVAGRLAPGPRDIVVVASRRGVQARVPALAGHPAAFEEAFARSRREMAFSLSRGLPAFIAALDARAGELARSERIIGLAALGAFLALGAWAFARYRGFHRLRSGWIRSDTSAHEDLVALCQERLARLAAPGAVPGDPGIYDRAYAELALLKARPPLEARADLTRLADTLSAAVDRAEAR